MPISEFRKKKLLYVFNVFFDVNQSGTIDKKDFELAIEKVCKLRGWGPGTDQYKKTFDSMIQIWVSVDEWSSMWDDFAKDPNNPLEWQQQYMKFMFDLEDASNDGSIDSDEFTSVCSSYGLNASECKEAFQKISGGNKTVTFDQFQGLWKQFFTSENPSDPGNFIFGKTKF
ncbi:calexcitin-2 [Agrilus planipennis]|uniref:Calexcitin-2 n=1 Tax=Agrilus planipennis TaxID=224129 RepID=A0A1W4XCU0_AGRPL|nr:calexcitin-2 [Agrilus planipennis]